MSRLLAALLVVVLARPDALLGQAAAQAGSIAPGARVRITQVGQKPRIAQVVTHGADTLTVRWPQLTTNVSVPLAQISRLEVSAGRHRRVLKGAVVGTLSAGTVGAVIGAATYSPCTKTGIFGCAFEPKSRGEAVLIGGVAGGVLGLVVGSLAGLPSRETWRQVSLDARRVAVAVTPRARGTDLGVSLRF